MYSEIESNKNKKEIKSKGDSVACVNCFIKDLDILEATFAK